MIYTALRAVMIYQACGLDKKRSNFWQTKVTSFLVEVRVWLGEKCSELSDMLATTEFPLDKDGLIAAEAWLRSQYQAYASEI